MQIRLLKELKLLYINKKLSKQRYNTFKGQVLSDDVNGALKGLLRLKIVDERWIIENIVR